MKEFYVYAITNLVNGKNYVGITSNYMSRWGDHISALRRQDHHSYRLQYDWEEYGEELFEFQVLEDSVPECSKYDREQYWMDKLNSYDAECGYNISPTAGTTLGRRHRESAKLKMSETHSGKTLTEEHKESISKSMKNVIKTEEHQQKITESIRNRPLSIYARGENAGGAKLKEAQVIKILKLLDSGVAVAKLSEQFNVSKSAIRAIQTKKTWKYVTEKYETQKNGGDVNAS